jgi:hypothetical protein
MTQASIVDALRINTVLLDIDLLREEFDKVLLDDDVYPRLVQDLLENKEKGNSASLLMSDARAGVPPYRYALSILSRRRLTFTFNSVIHRWTGDPDIDCVEVLLFDVKAYTLSNDSN